MLQQPCHLGHPCAGVNMNMNIILNVNTNINIFWPPWQALRSEDKALLERCLAVSSPDIIANTVSRLQVRSNCRCQYRHARPQLVPADCAASPPWTALTHWP